MMARLVVFLAEGFEEIEAVTPIDYLRRAGVQVETVAIPAGGKADPLVVGSHNIPVKADMTFDELAMREGGLPDGVFIPGGMPGAANVGSCELALDFIKQMFAQKKLVAAICAAPAVVLAKTGVLAGRKYTCYPGMNRFEDYCGSKEAADRLTAGAILVPDQPFVVDQNLITGRGPGAAEQFAMAIVEAFCGAETAQKIKKGSVQR
jgi:4-methyl-5(b-hydroxyethyl)-thiazole monophosphate biosynthesis